MAFSLPKLAQRAEENCDLKCSLLNYRNANHHNDILNEIDICYIASSASRQNESNCLQRLNVVPRSTMNTNGGTYREFKTLKCKLKRYVKPIKDPLGVSSSKGNQGTTRVKKKFF